MGWDPKHDARVTDNYHSARKSERKRGELTIWSTPPFLRKVI
jgi:hypothetical protein